MSEDHGSDSRDHASVGVHIYADPRRQARSGVLAVRLVPQLIVSDTTFEVLDHEAHVVEIRLYLDDALYRQGLEVVDRAIARAPGGRLVVADPNLQMHTADELRAELQRGLARELSDLSPMKVFAERK